MMPKTNLNRYNNWTFKTIAGDEIIYFILHIICMLHIHASGVLTMINRYANKNY